MEYKERKEIFDWIKSELEAKDTRIKALESAIQGFIGDEYTGHGRIIAYKEKFKELLKQQ